MRIEFVEIANFRKLRSTRVGFATDKTVFVGANNSGKTSAMVALRYFLLDRERSNFSLNDFTLSHWPTLNAMGVEWEEAKGADQPLPVVSWSEVLPFLDVWLHVEDHEIHYVQKILPTLDWEGGLLGVRLRFEPKDTQTLQKEYVTARADVIKVKAVGGGAADSAVSKSQAETAEFELSLWPENLTEFLRRRLGVLFTVKAYVLDPSKREDPEYGTAKPQALTEGAEPIDGDPFKGLIRIDEISAQRGFGQLESAGVTGDYEDGGGNSTSATRKLSDQLRRYYNRHLDPYERPDTQDLLALKAIEEAQKAFDGRLKAGFAVPLQEMETIGYPGVTDPKLSISTRLNPIDGLKHEAAVRYIIAMKDGEQVVDLHLPEDSNGLGYQNLISMVFRLMSFRDAWMRVGKARSRNIDTSETVIPPLHLVLIEEPEAYLHTQVQQVFIRQAYKILRNHNDLNANLTTQLIVSTHSSHIAHECEFDSLRYFRRMPAATGDIPISRVVNLANVFGSDVDTRRFVTRYLSVVHCDLFFADAAVLIEGPAERILVPHFVKYYSEFKSLSECYITWLEIGGSHAHRLRNLIEHLGLTTLIITDLDATDEEGNSAAPKQGLQQRSRNETLKSWCPSSSLLDQLIGKTAGEKILTYAKEAFSIRVAYQQPIPVTFKEIQGEALANTLEDALVFQNLAFFSAHSGKGLIARCRNAIEASTTITELGEKLFEELRSGRGKVEMALDLLETADPKALIPPAYIREGLIWLADQLRKHHQALGLSLTASPADGAKKEAA